MTHDKNGTTIDGISCRVLGHADPGGPWTLAFQRAFADIETIEKINWARPSWGGDLSLVPVGYGFRVDRIDYSTELKTYYVRLLAQEQYWGGVTGYQAEIRTLNTALEASRRETEEARAETATAILQASTARKAADAALEKAYTEGVNTSDL